ncbi:MAG: hypothetical protein HY804_05875 [Nitrospinae bacterium]|nr:hypothetical protein [Nitrospinota bacterium]
MKKEVKGVAPEAMKKLILYDWPGNVRELENIVERALILEETAEITPESLPEKLVYPGDGSQTQAVESKLSIDRYIQSFIQRYERVYKEKDIARMLGISRKSLWERRKKWGMERAPSRRDD